MTHGSTFSGIGGFDLSAYELGWENKFNCEVDSFCQKALKFHFPEAIQYKDIRNTNFSAWHNKINVLSGGFP